MFITINVGTVLSRLIKSPRGSPPFTCLCPPQIPYFQNVNKRADSTTITTELGKMNTVKQIRGWNASIFVEIMINVSTGAGWLLIMNMLNTEKSVFYTTAEREIRLLTIM